MNLKESVGIEVEKIDNTVTKGSSMYRERPVYKLVGVVENELSLGGKGCLENKCFNWYYWEYFQIDGESSFFCNGKSCPKEYNIKRQCMIFIDAYSINQGKTHQLQRRWFE